MARWGARQKKWQAGQLTLSHVRLMHFRQKMAREQGGARQKKGQAGQLTLSHVGPNTLQAEEDGKGARGTRQKKWPAGQLTLSNVGPNTLQAEDSPYLSVSKELEEVGENPSSFSKFCWYKD